jgi:hypothetical protein
MSFVPGGKTATGVKVSIRKSGLIATLPASAMPFLVTLPPASDISIVATHERGIGIQRTHPARAERLKGTETAPMQKPARIPSAAAQQQSHSRFQNIEGGIRKDQPGITWKEGRPVAGLTWTTSLRESLL